MKHTIWLYGLALALLTILLETLEYRYYLRDLSMEFYIGMIAVLFTGLGIWVGLKLTRQKRNDYQKKKISAPEGFKIDQSRIEALKISSREVEVLQLIAEGYSNQEIADRLFISLNTVKTHSSNLFAKLDVRRRTQAVQKAKDLGIIE